MALLGFLKLVFTTVLVTYIQVGASNRQMAERIREHEAEVQQQMIEVEQGGGEIRIQIDPAQAGDARKFRVEMKDGKAVVVPMDEDE